MMKKHILISLLVLNSIAVFSQKKELLLLKIFQNHADSTVVIEHTWGAFSTRHARILSKKGDTITAYNYIDPRVTLAYSYPKGILPQAMKEKIFRARSGDSDKLLDSMTVNLFLNSEMIKLDSLAFLWNQMMVNNPWSIKDKYEDACSNRPEVKIYDGAYIYMYRITKDKIERLSFYEPAHFEKLENCPGNPDRQAILRMDSLFNRYIGKIQTKSN